MARYPRVRLLALLVLVVGTGQGCIGLAAPAAVPVIVGATSAISGYLYGTKEAPHATPAPPVPVVESDPVAQTR